MADNSNRACSIGCLFTPQQLGYFKEKIATHSDVTRLSKLVGAKNLKAMTGFNLNELKQIQDANDSVLETKGNIILSHSEYVKSLEESLKTGVLKIRDYVIDRDKLRVKSIKIKG